MGSPISNLLMQAAPAPAQKDVSKMSQEELAAYVASLNASNPLPEPTPTPTPVPTPAPVAGAAPPQQNAIMRFLMSLLPSTQSLAPTPPPVAADPVAEEEARRRRVQQIAPPPQQ